MQFVTFVFCYEFPCSVGGQTPTYWPVMEGGPEIRYKRDFYVSSLYHTAPENYFGHWSHRYVEQYNNTAIDITLKDTCVKWRVFLRARVLVFLFML